MSLVEALEMGPILCVAICMLSFVCAKRNATQSKTQRRSQRSVEESFLRLFSDNV